MNDIDEKQDQLIRRLSPELRVPGRLADPAGPAAEELRELIMAGAGQETWPAPLERPRRSWLWRWRFALAAPVVAGLVVLAFLITAVLPASSPVGPDQAQAATLQFTASDGYVDIKILDPAADPQRYRAELSARGLDIDLAVAPATPDRVGRVIFQEVDSRGGPQLQTIEAPGDCSANGNCSVAIRVPTTFEGYARIVFGRTATPGETVEGDAPVLSADQEAQLKALVGKRVSEVRTTLAARGQTATYRVGAKSREATADQVPGSWYVYDVAPLSGNVVVLWVSADGEEP